MATMIYATTDRDEAHRFLADVLDGPGKSSGGESKEYESAIAAVDKAGCSSAECREDPNAPMPYQVWSAGEEYVVRPPTEPPKIDVADGLDAGELAQLKKLLAMIKGQPDG